MKDHPLVRILCLSAQIVHVLVSLGFFLLFLVAASWVLTLCLTLPSIPLDSIFVWALAVAVGLIFTVPPLASAVEQLSDAMRPKEPAETLVESMTEGVEPQCPTP